MKINKGKFLIYRVFDVASEVDLKKAKDIMDKTETGAVSFENNHKSLIINDPPIALKVKQEEKVLGRSVGVSAKIWKYGCISICLSIDVSDMEFQDLNNFYREAEGSEDVLRFCQKQMAQVFHKIQKGLVKPKVNKEIYEDFSVFVIQEILDGDKVVLEISNDILEKLDLNSLPVMAGEQELELSDRAKTINTKDCFQYSKKDLALVDWDSSLIIDLSDKGIYKRYVQIIEFSLTRLLELRIYDEFLDRELAKLYSAVETSHNKWGRKKHRQISKRSHLLYIEVSDLLDQVNNSLKTIGDSYLASFFRLTNDKFRFQDWSESLNKKLGNLGRITEILQNEAANEKSHFLEWIIIVLITIEVVPFVYDLVKGMV